MIGTSWFTDTVRCNGFGNHGSDAASLFGRKTLGAGFGEVVAALGTGVSLIFPSLMIGIDQKIVAERLKTFGKAINGVLLCAGEHGGVPSWRHHSDLTTSDKGHYHI